MTTLQAVPSDPHPWSPLLSRTDVAVVDGVIRLRHRATTPEDARTADLLLVADTLEAAGIEIMLIRHARRTPALVVDARDRPAALLALHDAGRFEPLYVKSRGATAVLAADLRVDVAPVEPLPGSYRVFRPRIVEGADLTYGVEYAVRLEFWLRDGDVIRAPRANALTRKVFDRADATHTTVEMFGRTWNTLVDMFTPQPDEVTAEIDLVFSWVDGSSSEFQRQRAAQMEGYIVGEGDESAARYRHVDELRYALRSVHMYAPWVRRIFIVTDSPRPAWLIDDPRVTVVRSEEFFADPSVLPTHNSHAVESQLHHIDGLAEHFLYSNDDMFFARPVEPELFFTSGGVTKFVECPIRIGVGAPRLHRSGHDNGLRVNRALLQERYGRTILRDLEHCATPLRRSVMSELEETFPDDFARTAASRFRAATDISVTNSLYHYFALMTGRAVASTEPTVEYVQSTLAAGLRRMQRLATRRDVDMFCINDGGSSEVPEELRIRAVRDTLESTFPVPAPWEVSAVSAGQESDGSAEPIAVPR